VLELFVHCIGLPVASHKVFECRGRSHFLHLLFDAITCSWFSNQIVSFFLPAYFLWSSSISVRKAIGQSDQAGPVTLEGFWSLVYIALFSIVARLLFFSFYSSFQRVHIGFFGILRKTILKPNTELLAILESLQNVVKRNTLNVFKSFLYSGP
jgi:hypothetical protein